MLWNKLGATLANSNNPSKAIGAYVNALNHNPSYIRARCNIAIACIQMGQYREAAEHFITALTIQSNHSIPSHSSVETGVQSSTIWNHLKMVFDAYLNRSDLATACDRRDLNAIKTSM